MQISLILISVAQISLADFFHSRLSKYGYTGESYKVNTDDGYKLGLYRILSKKPVGSPVLLIHGLFASSDIYMAVGPAAGLAYQLSDIGYDVWLPNSRGNLLSREHETFPTSSASFWNYTFHEIALFDLAATIDFIRKETNQDKVHCIGHSQGSTITLILLSERPEYNEFVKSATLLAPVAYLGNLQNKPIQTIFDTFFISYLGMPMGQIKETIDSVGSFEMFPYNKEFSELTISACLRYLEFCKNFFEMFGLIGRNHFNETLVRRGLAVIPCGASVNQFAHYSQLLSSNQFQQFDWGERRNLLKYGSKTPPEYKLENIKAPVNLFYSDLDLFIHWPDVDKLIERLPNVQFTKFIKDKNWMHFDYVTGNNVTNVINKDVIKLLIKSDKL